MQIHEICIMSYTPNMQMMRIIYELLHLPQCSHNLEFFFTHISPPILAGITCATLINQTYTKQANPLKRLPAGYCY